MRKWTQIDVGQNPHLHEMRTHNEGEVRTLQTNDSIFVDIDVKGRVQNFLTSGALAL